MQVNIEQSWKKVLADYFETDNFTNLASFVRSEYASGKSIYPKASNIFNAFWLTPFDQVKVVILGQDPYHQPDQAMGLSFSVPTEIKNPPSLVNIFKELESELGCKSEAESKFSGDLSTWADQGVLLLNSVLTVAGSKPGSHAKKGWEEFTDQVIKTISDQKTGVIFLLWGNYAKNKSTLIDQSKHSVLSSAHPSPFSAYNGFFGNDHFTKTNQVLKSNGLEPIKW